MTYLRLDGRRSTLVFAIGAAVPVCCYWGERLAADTPLDAFGDLDWQPVPPGVLNRPVGLTLWPENGRGWWGQPALKGHRSGRHWSNRFVLDTHTASDDALHLRLNDAAAELTLDLDLSLDPDTGVLVQQVRLTNTGETDYTVDWCAAAALPLPPEADELLLFEGAWSKEFGLRRQPFPTGALIQENTRGRTSHVCFPGLIAGPKGFDEQTGAVFGFHLGWSGNHRMVAERTGDGWRQVQLGECFMPGEMVLGPGQSYRSPAAYACRAEGLNQMSNRLHAFLRTRILPPAVASTPRPVQYNTWEAVYFQQDLDTLKLLADQAADLGVERFVLDDGWFAGRTDDGRALGDWTPDAAKYPEGLGPLIAHVNDRGMRFGLWVEPEMVNPDSDLYRRHPDWVLNCDPLPRDTGRNQLVLDLTLPAVSDHLFAVLDGLLAAHRIDYLKWDMNRDLTTAGHDGRPAYHGQVEALYTLVDRLGAAHPAVEIETCASGGGRIDFGILKRTHRAWTSDCNDALERLRIQQGFSLFFPPEIMGSHLGPACAHTTGRRLPLEIRGLAAFNGHLGLELDLRELTAAQRGWLKALIAAHKVERRLLHGGRCLRLQPADRGRLGWGVIAADAGEALYGLMQVETPAPGAPQRVRLPGLDPRRRYRLRPLLPMAGGTEIFPLPAAPWAEEGLLATGQLLAGAGINIALPNPATGILLKAAAEE